MSKLIIVAIPDSYNLNNVIRRIQLEFNDDEKIAVIPAKSYQEIKAIESSDVR